MLRALPFGFFALLAVVVDGNAQGISPPPTGLSRPVVGGSPGLPPPPNTPIIRGSQNLDILRHRDPTGKPCLTVSGFARPYTANPNLFDHVIQAANTCLQVLRLEVCYYQTQKCTPMIVPSRGFKEAILGTVPTLKDFRYEFRERF